MRQNIDFGFGDYIPNLQNKWMEFFPNIVSRATIVEVISTGLMGGRNGSLQLVITLLNSFTFSPCLYDICIYYGTNVLKMNLFLLQMYEELQVLSPLVPTREFYFLRFCQQIEQNAWAIVDVSYDFPEESHSNSQCRARRLPSGCIIQDMLNGCSKVLTKSLATEFSFCVF